eukprot:scaffold92709_cov19-Tisochrysis_lutea.AAC.2
MHKRKAARKAEEGFRRMDEEDPYAAARRGQLPLTRELQVRLSSGLGVRAPKTEASSMQT